MLLVLVDVCTIPVGDGDRWNVGWKIVGVGVIVRGQKTVGDTEVCLIGCKKKANLLLVYMHIHCNVAS